MSEIKVIFTGGTIGSLADGNNINTDEKAKRMLIDLYSKQSKSCENNAKNFDIVAPINILSENAIVDDVLAMANEIKEAEKQGAKGVIMTHGSDTLAYSGAYLSFLLYDIKIPVVLVASNYILTDAKANGLANFTTAVDFLNSKNAKSGIFVSYKNPQDNFVSIHLASRMCEPGPYSDSFYSIDGLRYAKSENGKIVFENTKFEKTDKKFKFESEFTKSALYINPFTGLDYNVYKNKKYDFVLHNLYHSGTANTQNYVNENFDTNILNFAKYLQNENIPLYLVNIKNRDMNYDSTNKMKKLGVKFLYDTLPNVALAKLNVAYNLLPKDKIDEFLETNISGEMIAEQSKK